MPCFHALWIIYLEQRSLFEPEPSRAPLAIPEPRACIDIVDLDVNPSSPCYPKRFRSVSRCPARRKLSRDVRWRRF
jgi:hypothetical protein